MADVVSKATRSRMMSGIRTSKTKPELQVRALLRGCGYRRSYDVKSLPGRPDIVIHSKEIAIFVHGCFWHRHGCQIFKWPNTRPLFWRKKLELNRRRDQRVYADLAARGWRVMVIWQCALSDSSDERPQMATRLTKWVASAARFTVIHGRR